MRLLSGLSADTRHLCLQIREDVYEKIDKELLEYVEDVLLNRCSNSTERMLEFAATLDPKSKPCALVRKGGVKGAVTAAAAASWRDGSVVDRLKHALIKARACSLLRHVPCQEGSVRPDGA